MIKFIKEKLNKMLDKIIIIRKTYRNYTESHKFVSTLLFILKMTWIFFDLILMIKEEKIDVVKI